MNNNQKLGHTPYIVIGILLVVYILLVVVIPFPKGIAAWTVFFFTVLSFIGCSGIIRFAFAKGDTSLKSRVYGFPVFRVGYLYLTAQVILSVIIYLIGSFTAIKVWIAFVLSIIILAFALIGIIATDAARDVIQSIEQQTEASVAVHKNFTLDVASASALASTPAIKAAMHKLEEQVRFSDPVSASELDSIETELNTMLCDLMIQMRTSDEPTILAKIQNISQTLEERNRLCKAYKK